MTAYLLCSPGDSSVGLKEGNVISLEQALYATLLASANEAAYAVAENVGKMPDMITTGSSSR